MKDLPVEMGGSFQFDMYTMALLRISRLVFRQQERILPTAGSHKKAKVSTNRCNVKVARGIAMRFVIMKYCALSPKYISSNGSTAIWQPTEMDMLSQNFKTV